MADLAQQIKQRDQISANHGGKEELVVARGLVSIHIKLSFTETQIWH